MRPLAVAAAGLSLPAVPAAGLSLAVASACLTLAAVSAAGVTLAATVAAGAEAPAVESHLAAAARGETGIVDGRAYAERRRPDGPDLPLRGVVVTLAPHSDALIGEVERVRAHARDSLRAYRAAALEVRRLQEAYEKALREAGAAGLVRSSPVGPDGQFSFSDVAAGRWLLWGRHEVLNPLTPRQPKGPDDRETFVLSPALVGYRTASFWMIPLGVNAGTATTVELTDRNVWFTGVVEETVRQDPRR